mmetsp:Transcript_555/g.644  ORF Transcript_555/g.644 Transcript_555/m.644 type:complete len:100 (-) Transcript_555:445-744(-)
MNLLIFIVFSSSSISWKPLESEGLAISFMVEPEVAKAIRSSAWMELGLDFDWGSMLTVSLDIELAPRRRELIFFLSTIVMYMVAMAIICGGKRRCRSVM